MQSDRSFVIAASALEWLDTQSIRELQVCSALLLDRTFRIVEDRRPSRPRPRWRPGALQTIFASRRLLLNDVPHSVRASLAAVPPDSPSDFSQDDEYFATGCAFEARDISPTVSDSPEIIDDWLRLFPNEFEQESEEEDSIVVIDDSDSDLVLIGSG